MIKTPPSKDFDLQKKICLEKLYKPDKSRKGEVDKPIIPLIDYLNRLDDFYTTSSCSGRIMLLTHAEKKPDVKWLYASHEKVKLSDIKKILGDKDNLPKEMVWIRQESMILHVACRSIDDANNILKIARDIGLRRSGIIADSNIIMVEICSTESVDVPLADKGRLIVDDGYIKMITVIVNQKFMKGRERLKRLEKDVREKLR